MCIINLAKKTRTQSYVVVYIANVSSRIADLKVKRAKKTKKRIDDKRNPRIASEERSNQSVSFLGSSSNSAHSAGNSNGASRLHSPFEKRHIWRRSVIDDAVTEKWSGRSVVSPLLLPYMWSYPLLEAVGLRTYVVVRGGLKRSSSASLRILRNRNNPGKL